jgi:hypothetical protein
VPWDPVADADSTADPGAGARRAVAIDLQDALLRLGAVDGIYIVVGEIPAGVRLSAGRFNGDDTFSLGPGDVDGLQAVLPPGLTRPFTLRVRILTPDPCGYEYASTSAEFTVSVDPETAVAVVPAASDVDVAPPRADVAQDDARAAAERRLAAARAEWQAEEEHRFARCRARWEADEEERWRARQAALQAECAAALAAAEAEWRRREAAHLAAVEAQWSARLATSEARRRTGDDTRQAAAAPAAHTRFRRIFGGLAAAAGLSGIALVLWML